MSSTVPSLTVVVPAYQAAVTLGRCLRALAAALPDGADVIVVDDGSTDTTADVARAAGVQVLSHPRNRGTSAARNTGWRATDAALVAFVDADMVVYPDALTRLLGALADQPNLGAANGTVAVEVPGLDVVSDFVNTSLHWQLSRHGERVASAFTAICVFRRETLEQMGGWDERWYSRYADDVSTRFVLPPGSIGSVPDARGDHHKTVSFRGLMRHRANVGYFFVVSVSAQMPERRAGNVVLDLRYPLNTAAAASTLLALPLGPLALAPLPIFVAANARFCLFAARSRGPLRGALALPLSVAEGYAYVAGVAAGAAHVLRRRIKGEPADGP
jgi:glycosyltransferase involved in cell wall biosynthesis